MLVTASGSFTTANTRGSNILPSQKMSATPCARSYSTCHLPPCMMEMFLGLRVNSPLVKLRPSSLVVCENAIWTANNKIKPKPRQSENRRNIFFPATRVILFFAGQFDDHALKFFPARRHKTIPHQRRAVNDLSVAGQL